jgi:ribosomal-protein-alanine N-acetyltransferase
LATDRKSTHVRPIRPGDLHRLMRFISTDWRVQLRIAPTELPAKIRALPGYVAEDRVGVRGFAMFEPLPSKIGLLVAVGLRDTWRVEPFLDLLLPILQQSARDRHLQALVYIGNAEWLLDDLQARGFKTREWIVSFERAGTEQPPHPILEPALLRSAHLHDLPALLRLDDQSFEHIWHKSAGNFSEALAHAGSFSVAIVDELIVAYQWCEMYGKHAHLTRLAVHPDYQGRGIGAQLLHRAITDCLSLGADWMTLNTQETNQRSQTLYERFGFVNTRQRIPVLWFAL